MKVFSFIEIVRINGYYCFYESGGEKIAYPVFEGQKGLPKIPPHGVFSSPDRTERLQGRQMHPVRSGIASPGITKDIPIIYRLLNN
ncbi:MAG: hypothetical protein COA98_06320 [Candidatus Neomarinimicrobiota bacterium]|nr:MAG: hypothetical protein COA98_06320 [Candidatus Neomarinimicrobiota bacterium]